MGQLIAGWSKGFAMGAVKTSIPVLIMIIAWITGAIGTTRHLIEALLITDVSLVISWGFLYLAFATQIYWMLYRIGNFKINHTLLCCFPFPSCSLSLFLLIPSSSFLYAEM